MKDELREKLSGGDLRSIGKADEVVSEIKSQMDFDILFDFLLSDNRLIAMRAADAIEKITMKRADFLCGHKEEVLALCKRADNIEFKWHLALLLSRLPFTENEHAEVFEVLSSWLIDPRESKIVRVNSMQALFEISKQDRAAQQQFENILNEVEKENIPSLLARIRKIRRQFHNK